MSIISEPVVTSLQKGFIHATIDPKTRDQLNLPTDYQFHEVFMWNKYAELAERYHNFEVRPDDIWICGFPKTGTIWMQNIVRRLKQKLDFDIPVKGAVQESFDLEVIFDEPNNEKKKEFIKFVEGHLERMNQMPSPRIFKSHLPAFLLPKQIWTKKPKVIYIARNPKDAFVSNFYMLKNGSPFVPVLTSSFEETIQLMINGETHFGPFPEHVLSFWQLRRLNHVLFLTYEELSADRFVGCKKISQFLGYDYDDDKLQELADFIEFNNMKKKMIVPPAFEGKDPNYSHCRKGQVGGYRNEMSQELIQRFDQWISDKFNKTDFDYSQWLLNCTKLNDLLW